MYSMTHPFAQLCGTAMVNAMQSHQTIVYQEYTGTKDEKSNHNRTNKQPPDTVHRCWSALSFMIDMFVWVLFVGKLYVSACSSVLFL